MCHWKILFTQFSAMSYLQPPLLMSRPVHRNSVVSFQIKQLTKEGKKAVRNLLKVRGYIFKKINNCKLSEATIFFLIFWRLLIWMCLLLKKLRCSQSEASIIYREFVLFFTGMSLILEIVIPSNPAIRLQERVGGKRWVEGEYLLTQWVLELHSAYRGCVNLSTRRRARLE